jgi:hypothetical protein
MFAALVLAIIERALEAGLDSPVVYVTRHYIARRLRYAWLSAALTLARIRSGS